MTAGFLKHYFLCSVLKFSSSVYDGHIWYLTFDLCSGLAMLLMLKSNDYRVKNHIALCVSDYNYQFCKV